MRTSEHWEICMRYVINWNHSRLGWFNCFSRQMQGGCGDVLTVLLPLWTEPWVGSRWGPDLRSPREWAGSRTSACLALGSARWLHPWWFCFLRCGGQVHRQRFLSGISCGPQSESDQESYCCDVLLVSTVSWWPDPGVVSAALVWRLSQARPLLEVTRFSTASHYWWLLLCIRHRQQTCWFSSARGEAAVDISPMQICTARWRAQPLTGVRAPHRSPKISPVFWSWILVIKLHLLHSSPPSLEWKEFVKAKHFIFIFIVTFASTHRQYDRTEAAPGGADVTVLNTVNLSPFWWKAFLKVRKTLALAWSTEHLHFSLPLRPT